MSGFPARDPGTDPSADADLDADLATRSREELAAEVRRLRAAVRAHRDSAGHDLCWHQPALWDLLPERDDPRRRGGPARVPAWPQFLRGCLRYRQSLDEQAPDARRTPEEFGE